MQIRKKEEDGVENIRISIITITLNSDKTLERTIQSIIRQDYDNLEYIVVDGGSEDKTLDIIRRYEKHISKWISEPDEGISDAFNKGIGMATGDIIGIVNSDDGLLPGALKKIQSVYDETIDVYRGKVLLWKEDSDTKVEEIPSMHLTYGAMNKIGHQSTFITASAYQKFGKYDVACRYVMDYELLLRFEKAGAKFRYVDSTLAFYSLGGLTFTKMTRARMEENIYARRKNGADNSELFKFLIVKLAKEAIRKFVPKEFLMKLRNGRIKSGARDENRSDQ